MSATVSKEGSLILSERVLLFLYSVVPAGLFIVFFDQFFLSQKILQQTSFNPERVRWYYLVFNFPHIVGSFLTFADTDYLRTSGRQLTRVFAAVFLGIVCLRALEANTLYILILFSYTVYHVVLQQMGIGRMLMKTQSRTYEIWKWLSLTLALVTYLKLYLPGAWEAWVGEIIWVPILLTIPVWFFLAWRASADSKTQIGKYYLWANQILILSTIYYSWKGYVLLGILLPRFVHDITAFYYYGVHDANRNLETKKNFFHKLTAWTHLPSMLIIPLWALLLAYPVSEYQWQSRLLVDLMVGITIAHYFVEGYIWKKDSLHRKYILQT